MRGERSRSRDRDERGGRGHDRDRGRERDRERDRDRNRNAFGWSKKQVPPMSRSGRIVKGRGVFVSKELKGCSY